MFCETGHWSIFIKLKMNKMFCLLTLTCQLNSALGFSAAHRLYNKLMVNYSRHIIPVFNNTPVLVKFGMKLNHVSELVSLMVGKYFVLEKTSTNRMDFRNFGKNSIINPIRVHKGRFVNRYNIIRLLLQSFSGAFVLNALNITLFLNF